MTCRLLVIGAGGQLGTELMQLDWDGVAVVAGWTRADIDLACSATIEGSLLHDRLRRAAPDVIVNAAAYTAVDTAEDEPGVAEAVNHRFPAQLARASAALGAKLVHVSTDYVFDGTHGRPLAETDHTNPLGVYGRTKLAGERAVLEQESHLVLRTAWLFSASGPNFVRTIRRVAGAGGDLRVVADQVGSPTSAAHLAAAVRSMVSDGLHTPGLFHAAAPDHSTWFELATGAVARRLPAVQLEIAPIRTEDWPTRAQRPHDTRLDVSRLRETYGIELPSWRVGLDQVSDQLNRRGED